MRALRSCPSEMSLTVSDRRLTGRIALHAIRYPPSTESTSSTGSTDHATGTIAAITPPVASVGMMPRSHTLPTTMSTLTS